MKDANEADLAAEMPGIGGDGRQHCSHGIEQDDILAYAEQ